MADENGNGSGDVRILAFLCNWCSYAGADLAGVSRLQYPPNVVDIRVMCTGTISPYHVLKAFQLGIDGVLIAGCHIGDCHYLKGNYMTHKRFQVIRDVLKFAGIDEDRIRLEWVSAAEGEKFAELIRSFTSQVEAAGPSPLRPVDGAPRAGGLRESFRAFCDIHGTSADYSAAAFVSPLNENMGIKERARELLKEVDGVLACRKTGGSNVPHLFTASDIDEMSEEMPDSERYPAAALARRLIASEPGLKLAVVSRGCDERALIELGKQEQVELSDIRVIGVACGEELARKCGCATPYPSSVDGGSKVDAAGRGDAGSLIEKLDALPADERLAYWLAQFGACVKCGGCRNICPLCYCKECALDDEELVRRGEVPPLQPVFHLIRAMDMAGRCVDCGLCEEACPMGIPLRALYRRVGDRVEERFGYRPGRDAGQKSPLAILGAEQDLK